jgi:hypothetical protein
MDPPRDLTRVLGRMLDLIPPDLVAFRVRLESVRREAAFASPESAQRLWDRVDAIIRDVMPTIRLDDSWTRRVNAIWTGRDVEPGDRMPAAAPGARRTGPDVAAGDGELEVAPPRCRDCRGTGLIRVVPSGPGDEAASRPVPAIEVGDGAVRCARCEGTGCGGPDRMQRMASFPNAFDGDAPDLYFYLSRDADTGAIGLDVNCGTVTASFLGLSGPQLRALGRFFREYAGELEGRP